MSLRLMTAGDRRMHELGVMEEALVNLLWDYLKKDPEHKGS